MFARISRRLAAIVMLCGMAASGLQGADMKRAAPSLAWESLPALPDREGFAGSFAGVSHGALLVAGGANFPDKRPWEGGAKVWYDSIFVLEKPTGQWQTGFKLPQPNGYGVSITTPRGLICLGGGNAKENFRSVFLLQWIEGKVTTTPLPDLPHPCAFMSGALVGKTIYLAGGIDTPNATTALKTFWALDLNDAKPRWTQLEAWPGPERILATAGAYGNSFYLFSGAQLKPGADGKPVREWLRDAYHYTPQRGWERLADLPRVAVAAPTPAPEAGSQILIIGGDDGTQVNTPPTEHKGFPRSVLAYDTKKNHWETLNDVPFSLVTTALVKWNGKIIIPGGEQKPGIRSPAAWSGTLKP